MTKKKTQKTKETKKIVKEEEKLYGIIEQAKIQNQTGETVKDFQAIHLLTEKEAEEVLNNCDDEPNLFLLTPVPVYKTENFVIQNVYSLNPNTIEGF